MCLCLLFAHSAAMSSILACLPPEIVARTLEFLDPEDLNRLFAVESLPHETHGGLVALRQMALRASFHNQKLVLSDVTVPGRQLLENMLSYLVANRVFIQPKDITFVLFDAPSYNESLAYVRHVIHYYWHALQFYTSSFSLQLLVSRENLFEETFQQLLDPFLFTSFVFTNISVKYNPRSLLTRHQIVESTQNLTTVNLHTNNEIAFKNASLSFCNLGVLLLHWQAAKSCYSSGHLKMLDLSFNCLTTDQLEEINFPELLETLSLANNNICCLNNRNFKYKKLVRLRRLDLSNNNLMSLSLFSGPQDPEYRLKDVNMACNNLISYGALFDGRGAFFNNVETLNLSRNFICSLSRLPGTLKSVNLSGNYLQGFPMQLDGNIFPSSLKELILTHCKIDHKPGKPDLVEHIVSTESLYGLQKLDISGNTISEVNTNYSPSLQVVYIWEAM